jgi:hypothetical protein
MGVLLGARPLRQRFTAFRSDLAKVNADTGDVMASATYQRFQARREAVASMQADLQWLARAESAFIADSGHPTTVLPPSYGYPKGRGNIGPFIRIERDGWSARMENSHTSMVCTLFAQLDTLHNRYMPGQPNCFSEDPREEYRASIGIGDPSTTRLRQTPWIAKGVCPGEGCSYGRWAACSVVVARPDKRWIMYDNYGRIATSSYGDDIARCRRP